MKRSGDLRLGIAGAFLAIACLSQLKVLSVAACALVAVVMAVASRRPMKKTWRRLLHVEGFVLLLFVTLPFTTPGQALLVLGPMTASVEGVSQAALIACKTTASVLILTMLGNLDPIRFGTALRGLYVPERVVRLFLLTVRYLSVIRSEALRLDEAMRARGFRPRSNWHTWRSYSNLVGMLLVRALDRGQRVEEAMMCRGYSGRYPNLPQPPPTSRDWLGFMVAAIFGFIVLMADRI